MKKNAIILISVLVFIAILFLLDLPAYNKASLLRSEIKRHKNLLEEKKELIIKVDQLKRVYESRKSEIENVYYSLPSAEDIPGLIVQFEALVSENGLILEELDFFEKKIKRGEEVERRSYKILEVTLSATGKYQSFKSFLEALELNIRLMDIKIIQFSSEETEEILGTGFLTFDIRLEVYYQ